MDILNASISEGEGGDADFASKINHKYKNLLDSDSEDDIRKNSTLISEPRDKKMVTRYLSSSSDTEPEKFARGKDRRKNSNPKKKSLSVKTVRKSAAKAKEIIAEKLSHNQQVELKKKIQSEKQRLEREQEIRVPYHKPKQYSLKDFLARRTLSKPLLDKTTERQKPMSSMLQLKLVGQNIESFAQKMKEREEEALEFFKSDSDSDVEVMSIIDEENIVNNEGAKPTKSSDEKGEEQHKSVLVNAEIDKIEKAQTSEIHIKIDLGLPAVAKRTEQEILSALVNSKMDELSEKFENKRSEEDEKLRLIVPTLKTLDEMGSNNEFVIDLESGSIQPRNLSGPEKLFQRYLKTIKKPKHKESICMNVISVENGKIENQKVEFKLDREVELDHNRPGISREKLKESIRQQILEDRIVKIEKKILKRGPEQLVPEDNHNFKTGLEISLTSDEKKDVKDQESEDDIEHEVKDEEEDIAEEHKKLKKSGFAFLDDEATDEVEFDTVSEDGESSCSSKDDETGEIVTIKKSRILKAFEDSDDESSYNPVLKKAREGVSNVALSQLVDSLKKTDSCEIIQQKKSDDIFSTEPSDFTFTEPSISEEISVTEIGALLDSETFEGGDNDLMDICSGQFPPTQTGSLQAIIKPDLVQLDTRGFDLDGSEFILQVQELPITVCLEENVQSPIKNYRKLFESSEEETDEIQEVVNEKEKKKKKQKPRVRKLDFSDDEDEQEEVEAYGNEKEFEEEQEEEDVIVDYDSEENEIEVKMNKKDRLKAAGAYFEDEAELSESEWGSADEDERDLDKFDIELGDEENFDQNNLREEVGRIHARRIADDDIKNVKKLQDMLFEDEENDGVGRDRKFRWKNQTEGFALENDNAFDGVLVENDEHDDDDNEIIWRKMRHERETMLNMQSQRNEETMSEDILLLDHTSQTVTSSSTSMFAKRKFKIIRGTSSMGSSSETQNVTIKKDSPFLIKSSNMKKFQNASFLSRGDQALTKIASFISRRDDDVANVSSHGGNSMSFITIEKPNDCRKRKSDDNKQQENLSKKPRTDTQKKQYLLDQL